MHVVAGTARPTELVARPLSSVRVRRGRAGRTLTRRAIGGDTRTSRAPLECMRAAIHTHKIENK